MTETTKDKVWRVCPSCGHRRPADQPDCQHRPAREDEQ